MKLEIESNSTSGGGPPTGTAPAETSTPPERVSPDDALISVDGAETMQGGGMGPRGRVWEGTQISSAVKRLLDIIVAAVILLLSAPLLGLVALAIVIESPGGVFYRTERVGFRGRTLWMLKFRKMHQDAVGGPLTAHGDRRLTRVGAVLTRTRLDELPQFWHVLRGEMSMIGPRPEDPFFVNCRPDDFAEILKVRPGISGFSQLAFADEHRILSRDDPVGDYIQRILPQKCGLDRLYVCRATLGVDARIALWTVVAVVLRRPVAVHRGGGAMSVRRRHPETSRVWAELGEPREVVAEMARQGPQ